MLQNNKLYIMALDQGTTSSRCIIFDRDGNVIAKAQKEFNQYFPKSGWVEQDPNEIWSSQAGVMMEATAQAGLDANNIAAQISVKQRSYGIRKQENQSIMPLYGSAEEQQIWSISSRKRDTSL